MRDRRLLALGEGAYSVSQVCRILGPTMTPRKVHYWLNTGLISGKPITRGRKGVPTVLTFRQLLEIRTVQHLRTTIGVSLREVRAAFEWVLSNLFDEHEHIEFAKGPGGVLIAKLGNGQEMTVPGGQFLMPAQIFELTDSVETTLRAWGESLLPATDHPHVVTNTRILGGAPVVRGTRIDTAVLATMARAGAVYDDQVLDEITQAYPHLRREEVEDALRFEGALRLVG